MLLKKHVSFFLIGLFLGVGLGRPSCGAEVTARGNLEIPDYLSKSARKRVEAVVKIFQEARRGGAKSIDRAIRELKKVDARELHEANEQKQQALEHLQVPSHP